MNTTELLQSAIEYHQKNKLSEADNIYRSILATDPKQPDALHLSGLIAFQNGDAQAAVVMIREAILHRDDQAQYYANLGRAHIALNQVSEAVPAYRKSLELEPTSAAVYSDLGAALVNLNEFEEAEHVSRLAVKLDDKQVNAWFHLGLIYQNQKMLNEAVRCYLKVVNLNPNFFEAFNNLANIERANGFFESAITHYNEAIRINPEIGETHGNLAVSLQETGQLDDAIISYRKALSLKPDDAEHHRNLAMALLLTGQYEEGWREYEWRWKTNYFAPQVRDLPGPRWNGESLSGKTLLVYCEQGYGDTIQFSRYLPKLSAMGINVIFECQPPLVKLVRSINSAGKIISQGDEPGEFDAHVPLLSLPRILGADENSIQNQPPYLSTAESTPLNSNSGPFKIGFAWRGSAAFKRDAIRSPGLEPFLPLLNIPGVQFYSLQKDNGPEEIEKHSAARLITDAGSGLTSFSETARVMDGLDLIISSDTAIAHLAGAMGKPVWTVLSHVPDWRWLLGRTDCPWYPTMRLFRQPKAGDWESVLQELKKSLAELIES